MAAGVERRREPVALSRTARAIGLGLVAVGIAGVLFPRKGATAFGLPSDNPSAHALVRAVAARDAVLGLLTIASAGDPVQVARTLAAISIVPFADAAVVATVRGWQPAHVLHLGGGLLTALAALAASGD